MSLGFANWNNNAGIFKISEVSNRWESVLSMTKANLGHRFPKKISKKYKSKHSSHSIQRIKPFALDKRLLQFGSFHHSTECSFIYKGDIGEAHSEEIHYGKEQTVDSQKKNIHYGQGLTVDPQKEDTQCGNRQAADPQKESIQYDGRQQTAGPQMDAIPHDGGHKVDFQNKNIDKDQIRVAEIPSKQGSSTRGISFWSELLRQHNVTNNSNERSGFPSAKRCLFKMQGRKHQKQRSNVNTTAVVSDHNKLEYRREQRDNRPKPWKTLPPDLSSRQHLNGTKDKSPVCFGRDSDGGWTKIDNYVPNVSQEIALKAFDSFSHSRTQTSSEPNLFPICYDDKCPGVEVDVLIPQDQQEIVDASFHNQPHVRSVKREPGDNVSSEFVKAREKSPKIRRISGSNTQQKVNETGNVGRVIKSEDTFIKIKHRPSLIPVKTPGTKENDLEDTQDSLSRSWKSLFDCPSLPFDKERNIVKGTRATGNRLLETKKTVRMTSASEQNQSKKFMTSQKPLLLLPKVKPEIAEKVKAMVDSYARFLEQEGVIRGSYHEHNTTEIEPEPKQIPVTLTSQDDQCSTGSRPTDNQIKKKQPESNVSKWAEHSPPKSRAGFVVPKILNPIKTKGFARPTLSALGKRRDDIQVAGGDKSKEKWLSQEISKASGSCPEEITSCLLHKKVQRRQSTLKAGSKICPVIKNVADRKNRNPAVVSGLRKIVQDGRKILESCQNSCRVKTKSTQKYNFRDSLKVKALHGPKSLEKQSHSRPTADKKAGTANVNKDSSKALFKSHGKHPSKDKRCTGDNSKVISCTTEDGCQSNIYRNKIKRNGTFTKGAATTNVQSPQRREIAHASAEYRESRKENNCEGTENYYQTNGFLATNKSIKMGQKVYCDYSSIPCNIEYHKDTTDTIVPLRESVRNEFLSCSSPLYDLNFKDKNCFASQRSNESSFCSPSSANEKRKTEQKFSFQTSPPFEHVTMGCKRRLHQSLYVSPPKDSIRDTSTSSWRSEEEPSLSSPHCETNFRSMSSHQSENKKDMHLSMIWPFDNKYSGATSSSERRHSSSVLATSRMESSKSTMKGISDLTYTSLESLSRDSQRNSNQQGDFEITSVLSDSALIYASANDLSALIAIRNIDYVRRNYSDNCIDMTSYQTYGRGILKKEAISFPLSCHSLPHCHPKSLEIPVSQRQAQKAHKKVYFRKSLSQSTKTNMKTTCQSLNEENRTSVEYKKPSVHSRKFKKNQSSCTTSTNNICSLGFNSEATKGSSHECLPSTSVPINESVTENISITHSPNTPSHSSFQQLLDFWEDKFKKERVIHSTRLKSETAGVHKTAKLEPCVPSTDVENIALPARRTNENSTTSTNMDDVFSHAKGKIAKPQDKNSSASPCKIKGISLPVGQDLPHKMTYPAQTSDSLYQVLTQPLKTAGNCHGRDNKQQRKLMGNTLTTLLPISFKDVARTEHGRNYEECPSCPKDLIRFRTLKPSKNTSQIVTCLTAEGDNSSINQKKVEVKTRSNNVERSKSTMEPKENKTSPTPRAYTKFDTVHRKKIEVNLYSNMISRKENASRHPAKSPAHKPFSENSMFVENTAEVTHFADVFNIPEDATPFDHPGGETVYLTESKECLPISMEAANTNLPFVDMISKVDTNCNIFDMTDDTLDTSEERGRHIQLKCDHKFHRTAGMADLISSRGPLLKSVCHDLICDSDNNEKHAVEAMTNLKEFDEQGRLQGIWDSRKESDKPFISAVRPITLPKKTSAKYENKKIEMREQKQAQQWQRPRLILGSSPSQEPDVSDYPMVECSYARGKNNFESCHNDPTKTCFEMSYISCASGDVNSTQMIDKNDMNDSSKQLDESFSKTGHIVLSTLPHESAKSEFPTRLCKGKSPPLFKSGHQIPLFQSNGDVNIVNKHGTGDVVREHSKSQRNEFKPLSTSRFEIEKTGREIQPFAGKTDKKVMDNQRFTNEGRSTLVSCKPVSLTEFISSKLIAEEYDKQDNFHEQKRPFGTKAESTILTRPRSFKLADNTLSPSVPKIRVKERRIHDFQKETTKEKEKAQDVGLQHKSEQNLDYKDERSKKKYIAERPNAKRSNFCIPKVSLLKENIASDDGGSKKGRFREVEIIIGNDVPVRKFVECFMSGLQGHLEQHNPYHQSSSKLKGRFDNKADKRDLIKVKGQRPTMDCRIFDMSASNMAGNGINRSKIAPQSEGSESTEYSVSNSDLVSKAKGQVSNRNDFSKPRWFNKRNVVFSERKQTRGKQRKEYPQRSLEMERSMKALIDEKLDKCHLYSPLGRLRTNRSSVHRGHRAHAKHLHRSRREDRGQMGYKYSGLTEANEEFSPLPRPLSWNKGDITRMGSFLNQRADPYFYRNNLQRGYDFFKPPDRRERFDIGRPRLLTFPKVQARSEGGHWSKPMEKEALQTIHVFAPCCFPTAGKSVKVVVPKEAELGSKSVQLCLTDNETNKECLITVEPKDKMAMLSPKVETKSGYVHVNFYPSKDDVGPMPVLVPRDLGTGENNRDGRKHDDNPNKPRSPQQQNQKAPGLRVEDNKQSLSQSDKPPETATALSLKSVDDSSHQKGTSLNSSGRLSRKSECYRYLDESPVGSFRNYVLTESRRPRAFKKCQVVDAIAQTEDFSFQRKQLKKKYPKYKRLITSDSGIPCKLSPRKNQVYERLSPCSSVFSNTASLLHSHYTREDFLTIPMRRAKRTSARRPITYIGSPSISQVKSSCPCLQGISMRWHSRPPVASIGTSPRRSVKSTDTSCGAQRYKWKTVTSKNVSTSPILTRSLPTAFAKRSQGNRRNRQSSRNEADYELLSSEDLGKDRRQRQPSMDFLRQSRQAPVKESPCDYRFNRSATVYPQRCEEILRTHCLGLESQRGYVYPREPRRRPPWDCDLYKAPIRTRLLRSQHCPPPSDRRGSPRKHVFEYKRQKPRPLTDNTSMLQRSQYENVRAPTTSKDNIKSRPKRLDDRSEQPPIMRAKPNDFHGEEILFQRYSNKKSFGGGKRYLEQSKHESCLDRSRKLEYQKSFQRLPDEEELDNHESSRRNLQYPDMAYLPEDDRQYKENIEEKDYEEEGEVVEDEEEKVDEEEEEKEGEKEEQEDAHRYQTQYQNLDSLTSPNEQDSEQESAHRFQTQYQNLDSLTSPNEQDSEQESAHQYQTQYQNLDSLTSPNDQGSELEGAHRFQTQYQNLDSLASPNDKDSINESPYPSSEPLQIDGLYYQAEGYDQEEYGKDTSLSTPNRQQSGCLSYQSPNQKRSVVTFGPEVDTLSDRNETSCSDVLPLQSQHDHAEIDDYPTKLQRFVNEQLPKSRPISQSSSFQEDVENRGRLLASSSSYGISPAWSKSGSSRNTPKASGSAGLCYRKNVSQRSPAPCGHHACNPSNTARSKQVSRSTSRRKISSAQVFKPIAKSKVGMGKFFGDPYSTRTTNFLHRDSSNVFPPHRKIPDVNTKRPSYNVSEAGCDQSVYNLGYKLRQVGTFENNVNVDQPFSYSPSPSPSDHQDPWPREEIYSTRSPSRVSSYQSYGDQNSQSPPQYSPSDRGQYSDPCAQSPRRPGNKIRPINAFFAYPNSPCFGSNFAPASKMSKFQDDYHDAPGRSNSYDQGQSPEVSSPDFNNVPHSTFHEDSGYETRDTMPGLDTGYSDYPTSKSFRRVKFPDQELWPLNDHMRLNANHCYAQRSVFDGTEQEKYRSRSNVCIPRKRRGYNQDCPGMDINVLRSRMNNKNRQTDRSCGQRSSPRWLDDWDRDILANIRNRHCETN